jgi:poly(3-hydroxyalkanoate) synthetase
MAGHASTIVDFKDQSQVQLALRHGLTNLYVVDWQGATSETSNTTIEDRIGFIRHCVTLLGGKVNLIGDCQGGWEASIYASLYPGTVNALIVAGAPIDTSVDRMPQLAPLIKAFELAGPTVTDAVLAAMVAYEGGVHRGLSQIALFMAMHPTTHLANHIKLFGDIRKPGAIEQFTKQYNWYFYPVDMSGALFKWVLPHLFIRNEFYRGVLDVGGRPAKLSAITCPVFLLAGESDDITPAPQMMNMANKLNARVHVHDLMVPGGHLGLFIGRNSQNNYWPKVLNAVRDLS